jgi:hypothetical protein
MRKLAIAAMALFMIAGIGQAAVIVLPPVTESLVEGHTVFTVLESVAARNTSGEDRFAAAVAFLVRETTTEESIFRDRFPGVLWFNDQYLVDPEANERVDRKNPVERYPCGALIAVNAGDPVPVNLTAGGVPYVPADAEYVESYHIEPPTSTGGGWDTDKWMWQGRPMWSVAVGGGAHSEARATQPDDGVSACGAASDSPCNGNVMPFTDDTPRENPVWHEDPTYYDNSSGVLGNEGRGGCTGYGAGRGSSSPGLGDNGYRYPCGGKDTPPPGTCQSLKFNAILFFFTDDLTVAGANKNHTDGSTDYNNDVAGCQNMTTTYPCPADDDDREGNSHPYSPFRPNDQQKYYPLGGMGEGRNNHGGSADCDGDGSGDQYCHQTNNVDLHYGYREAALPPRNWVVYDNEGATAPYHCHEDIPWCNEGDISSDL